MASNKFGFSSKFSQNEELEKSFEICPAEVVKAVNGINYENLPTLKAPAEEMAIDIDELAESRLKDLFEDEPEVIEVTNEASEVQTSSYRLNLEPYEMKRLARKLKINLNDIPKEGSINFIAHFFRHNAGHITCSISCN